MEETILLKEKEIKDIKYSVSDILLEIRNINEKYRRIIKLWTESLQNNG